MMVFIKTQIAVNCPGMTINNKTLTNIFMEICGIFVVIRVQKGSAMMDLI
jgi:hypothetical protein